MRPGIDMTAGDPQGADPGAVVIIADSSGRLLLHLRDDIPGIAWPGYWAVLGCGCDPGEHPDQAIFRELEEAGLGQLSLKALFEITPPPPPPPAPGSS